MRTYISETEDSTAVGNDSDGICLHRIFVGCLLILGNDLAGLCNTGSIGDCKILAVLYRCLCSCLELPIPLLMHQQCFFVGCHDITSFLVLFGLS